MNEQALQDSLDKMPSISGQSCEMKGGVGGASQVPRQDIQQGGAGVRHRPSQARGKLPTCGELTVAKQTTHA